MLIFKDHVWTSVWSLMSTKHSKTESQFYLYRTFRTKYCHNAASHKSNKPEATVQRKSSLRQHEETLRETENKGKPIILWMTPDSKIINRYSSIVLCYKVKQNLLKVFIISIIVFMVTAAGTSQQCRRTIISTESKVRLINLFVFF